jgi:hypothetical protein
MLANDEKHANEMVTREGQVIVWPVGEALAVTDWESAVPCRARAIRCLTG